MPAYIHHHDDIEPGFVICPSCVGLEMYVRDVEPHWSMAKIDFTYECADCGAEVRQTVVKPELRHKLGDSVGGQGRIAPCPPSSAR